jgi:hypothetical protein
VCGEGGARQIDGGREEVVAAGRNRDTGSSPAATFEQALEMIDDGGLSAARRIDRHQLGGECHNVQ